MFTGLIEEIGVVREIARFDGGIRIKLGARKVLDDVQVEHSLCINGTCLTVVRRGQDFLEVEAVEETLSKTNLRYLKVGDKVNLERALRPQDRLGGHIVQGHVDGLARLVRIEKQSGQFLFIVELPEQLEPFVIPKGSIALDGVSLTLAHLEGKRATIAIIPYTYQNTTLGAKKVGDWLNVEVDLIGKYVEKLWRRSGRPDFLPTAGKQIWTNEDSTRQSKISEDWLKSVGI